MPDPRKKISGLRAIGICKYGREQGHSSHWGIVKLYLVAYHGWQAFVREGKEHLGARPRLSDFRACRAPGIYFLPPPPPPSQTSATQAIQRTLFNTAQISWNCNYYFHFHGFFFPQVLIISNSEYQWQCWKRCCLMPSKFLWQNSYKPTCVTRPLYRGSRNIREYAEAWDVRWYLHWANKRPFGQWLLHALYCM